MVVEPKGIRNIVVRSAAIRSAAIRSAAIRSAASLEGANFIQLTFLLLNFLLYIFIIKTCKNVECFPFGVESFFELRFCKTSRGTKYDLLSTLETRVLLQRPSSRLLARIYGSRICTVFIRKNWICHGAPFA